MNSNWFKLAMKITKGESWPEGAYIISEKDRNAVRLENFCGR